MDRGRQTEQESRRLFQQIVSAGLCLWPGLAFIFNSFSCLLPCKWSCAQRFESREPAFGQKEQHKNYW